jgi:hypothetical protein
MFRFPSRGITSGNQIVQTGYGTHPAFCVIGYLGGGGGFPSELNARQHEAEYSAISSARIGMSGVAPPQPHVFVRRAQWQIYPTYATGIINMGTF